MLTGFYISILYPCCPYPENYNPEALGTTTSAFLCVSGLGCDASERVRMWWSELPVLGRTGSDVSAQAAAVVSEVGLRFGTVWSCSSWNRLPRES